MVINFYMYHNEYCTKENIKNFTGLKNFKAKKPLNQKIKTGVEMLPVYLSISGNFRK